MTIRALLLTLLALPACASMFNKLPTEKIALADMEEPLELHEEADDEAERTKLGAGAFTGAYVADARESLEQMEEDPEGLLITRIVENSPADAAGLEKGDILIAANDQELSWSSEWRRIELEAKPGDKLNVTYDRAGAERDAVLTVVGRVRPAGREAAKRFREEDNVGVVVRTATEVEARGAGLGPGGGAVIVGLSRRSPWRAAGLTFGDLIVDVDEKPIAHPNVLLEAIREAPDDGKLKLTYLRGGDKKTVEAAVTHRERQTQMVSIPLLYYYENNRGTKTVSVFFAIYKRTSTPAASETRIFWIFRFRGGDADRLDEVEE
ncbi:MAG: PDZ domain-containing protein [Planctomycetota bacterium]|jgi:S1-C subfamily serine protease